MTPENYPRTNWRLLITQPADGAWNMAVDEAILASVGAGQSLPTLRLYGWTPPCLSLGFAQPFKDIDPERLSVAGWDVVRRITGGRSILHTDELTYAVIAPYGEPRLAGSLLDSYRTLSQALLNALIHLGLPVQAVPGQNTGNDRTATKKPVCFEVPSHYEITVGGRKLVGSAQARKKPGILQHGTLPLYGDLTRIIQVLNFPDEADRTDVRNRLLDRAVTVESVLGTPISWDFAVEVFTQSFRQTLNLDFVDSPLSNEERSRVETLIKEKYAHPDWTERI